MKLVVAVKARDFFDQIDLALDIETPASEPDGEFLPPALRAAGQSQAAPECARSRCDGSFCPGCAATSSVEARSAPDRSVRATTSIASPTRFPAAGFRISSATRLVESTVDSKSAPRSKRCEASVCRPCRLRHLANGRRIPPCRLDQDVACLVGDHGVESAHDSGKRRLASSHRQQPDLPS